MHAVFCSFFILLAFRRSMCFPLENEVFDSRMLAYPALYNHSHFPYIIPKMKLTLWHEMIIFSYHKEHRDLTMLNVQPFKDEIPAESFMCLNPILIQMCFLTFMKICVIYNLLLNTIDENFSICALFANCSFQIITIHHMCELTCSGSLQPAQMPETHSQGNNEQNFFSAICLTFRNIFRLGNSSLIHN